MRINVPLEKQTLNEWNCGQAVISMILKYYKINEGLKEVEKEMKTHKTGTYMPQLGMYLIKKGFDVEIITMNPYLFTKNKKYKTQKNMIEHFEELQQNPKYKKFKESLNYFKEYIKAGGKITTKIPNLDDIKEEIKQGRPLIASVTNNFILQTKPIFNMHYNVITGIDEKNVYANDPRADEYYGKHKYTHEECMYAIHANTHFDTDNGAIMKITKKD